MSFFPDQSSTRNHFRAAEITSEDTLASGTCRQEHLREKNGLSTPYGCVLQDLQPTSFRWTLDMVSASRRCECNLAFAIVGHHVPRFAEWTLKCVSKLEAAYDVFQASTSRAEFLFIASSQSQTTTIGKQTDYRS